MKKQITVESLLKESLVSYKYRVWCAITGVQAVANVANLIWFFNNGTAFVSLWWFLLMVPSIVVAAHSEPNEHTVISSAHQKAIVNMLPEQMRRDLARVVTDYERERYDRRIVNDGYLRRGHVAELLERYNSSARRANGRELMAALLTPDS